MRPTRRQLLLGGVGATALVGLGAAGLQLRPGVIRAPRRPLLALDPVAFSVIAAVADRVCPAVDGLPSAWELEVPERVDELMSRMEPGQATDVGRALLLLESPLVSVLFGGPPTPFTRLDGARQDAVLASWRDGRALRRTVWRAATQLVKGTYWSHPSTWQHIGYARPAWATP
ncbi:MAG: gluconate 2-dehydrogenase subunit 3 family protein [Alphaproteobacteria bacterium]|nr:gluconate 2-dehydrogenase subunit 3 family protein [Alphaproteobacteria bacterium]MCB9698231.1 gluconate 2-dehydrogenase subunit 3 family protein [Alphaproteobacteria bacterium]